MKNKRQSNDLGVEVKNKAVEFGKYALDHFIQLIVVGVSSTQTFYLVSLFAPAWATWLPYFGTFLMEGGYLFWMWREFEADAADGSIEDVTMNEQERIANRMVYVTLGLSILTMLAGGFMEIAQTDLVSLLAKFPVVANYLALAAISGIFILAGLHLFFDWRYRRADPDVQINRLHRANMRQLTRQRQQAVDSGAESIMREEIGYHNVLVNDRKTELGRSRAVENFSAVYGADTPLTGFDERGFPTNGGSKS